MKDDKKICKLEYLDTTHLETNDSEESSEGNEEQA